MYSVARGNVYFVNLPDGSQPFPALIVRGPMHWDPKNTVTIIPSYSNYGGPKIIVENHDRNGWKSVHNYSFIPHLITTIPSECLTRYVGTLSDDEMRKIMTNLREIVMDDILTIVPTVDYRDSDLPWEDNDPTSESIYQDVRSESAPVAYKSITKTTRSNNTSKFDFGKIEETNPKVPKLDLVIHEDAKRESWMDPNIRYIDPNVSGFPPSAISQENLKHYALNFRIPDGYYYGKIRKRPLSILSKEELDSIRDGIVPEYVFGELKDLYDTFTPVDAMFFGKWMPSSVMQEIFDLSRSEIKVLKSLCVYMEKITDEELDERLKAQQEETVKQAEEQKPEESNKEESKYPVYTDRNEQKRTIDMIRPFIVSRNRLDDIPDRYAELFVRLPFYMIKGIYNGRNFSKEYKDAYKHYMEVLEQRDQSA